MARTKALQSLPALLSFLRGEAGGGALLILASAAAILIANVAPGVADIYHHALHQPLGHTLSAKLGEMTPHLWINDGLMALFFLVVGLEIKREWLEGRLSSWDERRLPIVAAAAGMVVPALVYLAVSHGHPGLASGWAIPAATDIAFALGVLALLGRHAPLSLQLLLATIAIVDDMGAVAIIAIAYTASIGIVALLAAALIFGAMLLLGRLGVRSLWPFLLLGLLLWYAVLLSGVHATIAGVLTAIAIPIGAKPGRESPLHRLEHVLHPWSAYLIVPLFGFANAGVTLGGDIAGELTAPLPLAVAAGLFIGKQIGIFGGIWASVRLGFAARPAGATWFQLYGLALLCGIGFTMSLFIGSLAFPGAPHLAEEAKAGILAGSLLSAVAGFILLRLAPDSPSLPRESAGDA